MIYLLFREINDLLFDRILICCLISIEITAFSQDVTPNIYIHHFCNYGIVVYYAYQT